MTKHNYFPVSLNVRGRECLVIGTGQEANDRRKKLIEAGARVTVVDPTKFRADQLANQCLVMLCVKDNSALTRDVAEACRKNRILLCAIDQPRFCDVVNVSVYDKGRLRMTISTGGAAPSVSKKIRLGLEASLKNEPLDKFLNDLASLRNRLEHSVSNANERVKKMYEAIAGFQFRASVQFPPGWKSSNKGKRK